MAWRPPSWMPPDAARNHHNALPHPERGGAHQLLSSRASRSDPVQAKMMNTAAAFPPPKPMQPPYIPPSPQVRLDYQNLPPRTLSSHSSSTLSSLSQPSRPYRPESRISMAHRPSVNSYQASNMASSKAPMAADTSPLWLEPSPQHKQARNDPFFGPKSRGYGPTSSSSRAALPTRGNVMPYEQGAPSYVSNTMGNHVPAIPSERSEDRYAIHTCTNTTLTLMPISEQAATTSLSANNPSIAAPVGWGSEIAASLTLPLSSNYRSTISTRPPPAT